MVIRPIGGVTEHSELPVHRDNQPQTTVQDGDEQTIHRVSDVHPGRPIMTDDTTIGDRPWRLVGILVLCRGSWPIHRKLVADRQTAIGNVV